MRTGATGMGLVTALVIACSTTVPTPTTAPERPTAAPPPPSSTAEPADLAVRGSGGCSIRNYGGCRPTLLLAARSNADFSDWVPSDIDYLFEMSLQSPYLALLAGPPKNGPATLAAGPWTVGLGVASNSDQPSDGVSADVLCSRSFEVRAGTHRVEIDARFERRCGIDILLDDIPVPVACDDETFYWLDDSGRDRIETKAYPAQDLVTIKVTAASDWTFVEQATVDASDPSCLDDPLIGPILRGVFDGYDPVSTEPADLVGRLMIIEADLGCSVLIDRDGLTWDPMWPAGYSVTAQGVFGPSGEVVADSGALVGLKGREISGGVRECLAGTGYRVTTLVFVEPLPAS